MVDEQYTPVIVDMTCTAKPVLMNLPCVVKRVGLSRSMIYKMIQQDDFPGPVKFGRKSLWPVERVETWLADRIEGAR